MKDVTKNDKLAKIITQVLYLQERTLFLSKVELTVHRKDMVELLSDRESPESLLTCVCERVPLPPSCQTSQSPRHVAQVVSIEHSLMESLHLIR